MKKVIERMNQKVDPESKGAAAGKEKDKQKKWLFRRASGNNVKADNEEEVEGMRVDFYLVVFLKFIASIVPTIEVDSTTSF